MDVAENPAKPAPQVGALVKRKRPTARPARERLAHQVAEREVNVLDDIKHLRIETWQRHAQLMVLERAIAGAAARLILHLAEIRVLDQHQRAILEALAQQPRCLI